MNKKNRGFTLIELLMTLAILGLLATITLPVSQLIQQRNKERELRTALIEIRTAIDAYKHASDDGRIAKSMGETGYPPNLEVLTSGVIDQRDPMRRKIFFLRRLPRNPLALPQAQDEINSWGLRSYTSEANDPKEGDDVYDVYVDSDQLGLNGIAYRYW
ncbi:type II secretion system protein [Undibacterium sp. Dicai25W]|uniref:type II secretion system protein n=1 Tax=Undibacterium sp. Dicai25W TaxID=3413034 RepID=UPI003BF2DEA9